MDVSVLIGRTFDSVVNSGNEILFISYSDMNYRMTHEQNCCEHVYIEDIDNDLSVLEGTPILEASEETGEIPDCFEYGMWTFYKFRTSKGHVTIRWNGQSNGYYSVGVEISKYNSQY